MEMEQESGRGDGSTFVIIKEEASSHHIAPLLHPICSNMSTIKEEPLSNQKQNFSGDNVSMPKWPSPYTPEEEPHSSYNIAATGFTTPTKHELTSCPIKEEPPSDEGHNLPDTNQSSLVDHRQNSYEGEDLSQGHTPQIKEEPSSDEGHNLPDTNQSSLADHRQNSYEGEDLSQGQTAQIKVEPTLHDPFLAQCPTAEIKEEPRSTDEEEPTNMDISAPPDHTQCLSNRTKEEEEDCPLTAILKGTTIDFDIQSSAITGEYNEGIEIKLKTKPMQDKWASTSLPSQSSKTTYACPVCKRGFSNHGNLVRHRETHNWKTMTCQECGADCCNKKDFRDHARIHKAEKVLHCSKCNISFQSKKLLAEHMAVHMDSKLKLHCSECHISFRSKKPLAEHMTVHMDSKLEEPKECPVDHAQLLSILDNDSNLPSNKKKGFPRINGTCGGDLPPETQTQLTSDHFHRTPSDTKAGPRSDKKEVPTSVLLAQKSGALNNGIEKPLSCSLCDKSFRRRAHLLRHHQKVHLGLKPFSCRHCKKRFMRKGQCLVHQRRHTGERPYPCSYCDKRFYQKAHMKIHERSHTGERPFACVFCGKRFSRKDRMQTHEKFHTDHRHCSACGKSLLWRELCEAHQKTSLLPLTDHSGCNTKSPPKTDI